MFAIEKLILFKLAFENENSDINYNCLGGVIVSILALSMEDYGFYPICKKL